MIIINLQPLASWILFSGFDIANTSFTTITNTTTECADVVYTQTYLPEDLKGKGEPSFSVDRGLKKEHNWRHLPKSASACTRGTGRRSEDIELTSRPRPQPRCGTDTGRDVGYSTSYRSTGHGDYTSHGKVMSGEGAGAISTSAGKDRDDEKFTVIGSEAATATRRRNSTGGRKLSDGFRRKFSGLVKKRDERE